MFYKYTPLSILSIYVASTLILKKEYSIIFSCFFNIHRLKTKYFLIFNTVKQLYKHSRTESPCYVLRAAYDISINNETNTCKNTTIPAAQLP